MSFTVFVAGTFNVLTEGHKKLLRTAVECMEGFRHICVYITVDDWARHKSVPVRPQSWRREDVCSFLGKECGLRIDQYSCGWLSHVDADYQRAEFRNSVDETDILVCSSETRENAEKLVEGTGCRLVVLERDPSMPSSTDIIKKSLAGEKVEVVRW